MGQSEEDDPPRMPLQEGPAPGPAPHPAGPALPAEPLTGVDEELIGDSRVVHVVDKKAAAKRAARISKSVNTAWGAGRGSERQGLEKMGSQRDRVKRNGRIKKDGVRREEQGQREKGRSGTQGQRETGDSRWAVGEGRLERRGAQVVLTSNAGVASSTWVDCSTSGRVQAVVVSHVRVVVVL